jgi:hypothetical protein
MSNEFSWVMARYACSPFEVYKQLQMGCERDVSERDETRRPPPKDPFIFKIASSGDSFLVWLEGDRISSSVEFRWTEKGISVRDNNKKPFLEATLTLNDEGECRLKVGTDSLTCWQFRRRSLEDLFFNF